MRRRTTRRQTRKFRKRKYRINKWLVAVAVTPLVCMALLVSVFLGRIETPRPALVLSPEQVQEFHEAQKAQHEHILEMEELERLEHNEKHHNGHFDAAKQHDHHLHDPKHHLKEPQHHDETLKQHAGPLKKKLRGHSHVIPNVVIFTHSRNLLEATNLTGEDLVLQQNVQHTIKLHKGATVKFFTDKDCIASIQNVMGQNTSLVDYFVKEQQGMYKADICRGAALHETGGLYFDVDLRARFAVWEALESHTNFVVPKVHWASKHKGAFFQAFIGATPQHPILYRYLELFLDYYQGNIKVDGPLGVLLLKRAFDETQSSDVALWQEVLYKKEWFPHVPPPNWGTRRACHFVVLANKKPPFVVPFYSRVKGSRMCGGKDSKGPPERKKKQEKEKK